MPDAGHQDDAKVKGSELSDPDVFISYSSQDRAVARRFAQCLEDEGLDVWWDAALRSGETFDEVIERALNAAGAVIVLWSPRSVTSRWVRAEATLADRRKKLIPVTIEPCDRPIIFELTHTSDLSHWHGDREDQIWRTVLNDVTRLVQAARAAKQPEAPAPAPRPVHPPKQNGVRAVDNRIFARLDARGPAEAQAEVEPDEDRTQFQTRGSPYRPAAQEELHCLELTIGERLEKRFIVSPGGLRIGRAGPAEVILADSRVSRSHCVVELMDNDLWVSDLNSTNGTFVDGDRVSGSAMLPVGSELKVGGVTFKHEKRLRAEV